MKKKIALLWPTFSFYHLARFRALHQQVGEAVLGIEFVGGEGEHWTGRGEREGRTGLPILTLFPHRNMRDVDRRELGRAAVKILESEGAECVFVNGYGTVELRMIIDWAWKNRKPCFTFSETKKNDFRRVFWKEWFKKRIIKKLSGAICGGRLHKEYLVELGMPEERIFLGYDAVDNDFFSGRSEQARSREAENRLRFGLPQKYFLSVSRFVEKKNIGRLISAYELYRQKCANGEPWGLVLCGSGEQEKKLKARVLKENIPGIIFAGSKGLSDLAVYYGLASCFILASTTEQWGLVINEAMASGLPVLVTQVAGAADELVEEGVNGLTFNPFNSQEIADLMVRITCMEESCLIAMGTSSLQKIMPYSPEYFAESVERLVSLSV